MMKVGVDLCFAVNNDCDLTLSFFGVEVSLCPAILVFEISDGRIFRFWNDHEGNLLAVDRLIKLNCLLKL